MFPALRKRGNTCIYNGNHTSIGSVAAKIYGDGGHTLRNVASVLKRCCYRDAAQSSHLRNDGQRDFGLHQKEQNLRTVSFFCGRKSESDSIVGVEKQYRRRFGKSNKSVAKFLKNLKIQLSQSSFK